MRFEQLIAGKKPASCTQGLRDHSHGKMRERLSAVRPDSIWRSFDPVQYRTSFERSGRGEFHQFLSTAKASCAELRSQIYVAVAVEYIDEHTFQSMCFDDWRTESVSGKTMKEQIELTSLTTQDFPHQLCGMFRVPPGEMLDLLPARDSRSDNVDFRSGGTYCRH